MPFSHHSHSGQFCGHATNTLEEVVTAAIEKKMQTLAMTEHMPRDLEADLYPAEVVIGQTTEYLFELFDAYYSRAKGLQAEYADTLPILVGFEIDWIRPSSEHLILNLLAKYQFDLFIGSVHHVHTIPVDYDQVLYDEARQKSGGTDEALYQDYFDTQLEMLKVLKPPIVGHFDLIRLKSDDFNGSFQQYKGVWQGILRNLDYVAGYGGVLELNSAALRKGMSEPYPKAEICKAFLERGGQFTLSDDSHGVNQIGYGFDHVLKFAQEVGILTITVFEKGMATKDARFRGITTKDIEVKDMAKFDYFTPTTQQQPS